MWRLLGTGCLVIWLAGCASSQPAVAPSEETIVIQTEAGGHQEDEILSAFRRGLDALSRHGAKRALDDGILEAAELCSFWLAETEAKVYAARTFTENFYYLVLAAAEEEESIVVDTACGEVFFLQAYSNVDLGRIDAAQNALENALALSPVNAHFLSEQGHIYHIRRDWEQALATFEKAEEYAAVYSPEEIRDAELARAKRGVGYSLIELGRLEEARTKFNECLAMNPEDQSALHELRYIEQLEAGR